MKATWLTVAGLVLAATAARAADKGDVVDLDGLKSAAPSSWKKEEPTEMQKAFRKAQFKIAKESGDPEDAEVVVFFFGPGGGGGKQANLTRWKGMFKAPAGEQAKVEEFKVGDVAATSIELSGTYLFRVGGPANPNAKVQEKSDFKMVSVIFESKNGPYCMRLVGPAKTFDKHKKEFDEWIKNFK